MQEPAKTDSIDLEKVDCTASELMNGPDIKHLAKARTGVSTTPTQDAERKGAGCLCSKRQRR